MFNFKVIGFGLLLSSSPLLAASPVVNWSLDSAVQRAWQVSAERSIAGAALSAAETKQRYASMWPNPSIELAVDNAIGKETGSGDSEISQITVSQAIPLSGRLSLQGEQAELQREQAAVLRQQQLLLLEREAAYIFHELQFDQAHMWLLQQRLTSAKEFQRIGLRREQGGDLSRLERLRLDLVSELTKQQIASAEGQFAEASAAFRTRFQVEGNIGRLDVLEQLPVLPSLEALVQRHAEHPDLQLLAFQIAAARQGVNIAKVSHIVDPEVWVSYERSYLNGRREGVTGVGISFTVPLWQQAQGATKVAQQAKNQLQFQLDARQRQLSNQLSVNHLNLSQLIKQADTFRAQMRAPAREIFTLTTESFAVGQSDILQLVDAVDIYYENELGYLQLLQKAWVAWADLRYAAGISLLESQSIAQGIKQ